MEDGLSFTGFKKVIATNDNGEEVPALLLFYNIAKKPPRPKKNRSPMKKNLVSSPLKKKLVSSPAKQLSTYSPLVMNLPSNSSKRATPTPVTLVQSTTAQFQTSLSHPQNVSESVVPTPAPRGAAQGPQLAETSSNIQEHTPFSTQHPEPSTSLTEEISTSAPPADETYEINAGPTPSASPVKSRVTPTGPGLTMASSLSQAFDSSPELTPTRETVPDPIAYEIVNTRSQETAPGYVHESQSTTTFAQPQQSHSPTKHISVVRHAQDEKAIMELSYLKKKCTLCFDTPLRYQCQMQTHIQNVHFKHAVSHNDLKSVACKLSCVDTLARMHYHCAHCPKIFRKKYLLEEHHNQLVRKIEKAQRISSSTRKMYRKPCPICSKVLQTKHMKRHLRSHEVKERSEVTMEYNVNDHDMDTDYDMIPTIYVVTQSVT